MGLVEDLGEFTGTSYSGLHFWVRKHKPKPNLCEGCNKPKKLELANISGEYKKDINDFKWLCSKCHMEFDDRIKNLIKFEKGHTPWNKGTKGVMKMNKTSFKKGGTSWNKNTNLSGMKGKKHSEKTKKIMFEKAILNKLESFMGTEKYHKSGFGRLKLTDGINYLRNKVDCYWLIDIVESYQDKLKEVPFQLWRIEVKSDKTAVVSCKEDTGKPNLVKQKLEYTDFPLSEFEFYCIDGVVLLKSEY